MGKTLGVIVLAFNEVNSLKSCVFDILSTFNEIEGELVISTSRAATPECLQVVSELKAIKPQIKVHFQTRPFVAAAVMEAVHKLDTDFVIYMSADGETPASLIPLLYQTIDEKNHDIVSASRWINKGSFQNYGTIKTILSWSAQKLCRIIYGSNLTEFTYGFRIYRRSFLSKCVFKESKHPFFVESLLVPLRVGARISEVPSKWSPRIEGKSVATLFTWLSYLRPIFKTRITPKNELLQLE